MAVEARPEYRIWLRYEDGVAGELDLSHLVGKGVFAAWLDRDLFRRVYIDDFGGIAWTEEIDMCPDALYMELTGMTPEEIWPGLATSESSSRCG